jgi:multidrug resistance protein, MATE family
VVESAVGLLGIAAFFQVFDGMQATAGGALRGMKDTRIPMVVGLVSYWLIGLTSGYVFAFPLGGGAEGLWWGLVLGLAFAAVLLGLRFHRLMPAQQTKPGQDLPARTLPEQSGDHQHVIERVRPRGDTESAQEIHGI